MDDLSVMQVVDCLQDLLDGSSSILLREFALVADAVKQLSASSQLSDDVVLVLSGVSVYHFNKKRGRPTLDSNQSTKLTM